MTRLLGVASLGVLTAGVLALRAGLRRNARERRSHPSAADIHVPAPPGRVYPH